MRFNITWNKKKSDKNARKNCPTGNVWLCGAGFNETKWSEVPNTECIYKGQWQKSLSIITFLGVKKPWTNLNVKSSGKPLVIHSKGKH